MKLIYQGAEAKVYEKNSKELIKKRIKKDYRHPEIDFELRKSRTTREANMLKKLPVPGPKLLYVDKENMTLTIEKIPGPKLADCLEKINYKKIAKEIAHITGTLHENNMIHGDLTTSNMILNEDDGKVYLIDFGLSFTSRKDEDKAVDLHLLKQALNSKHHTVAEAVFNQILKHYPDKTVLKRLEVVELRGRNKTK